MPKAKVYAVARGRATGLFTSWAACEAQVKGYPGAKYKGFTAADEAQNWLEAQGAAAPNTPGTAKRTPPQPRRASRQPAPAAQPSGPAAPKNPGQAASQADYLIHTDGSCLKNPGGPGGWAIVLQDKRTGETTEKSAGVPTTTNNRMELTAASEALAATPAGASVALYTDSQYLKNGLTKWLAGWKRRGWQRATGEPVLNQDLWQKLDALAAARRVSFHWVRGHVGNPLNERCDKLAKAEAQKFL